MAFEENVRLNKLLKGLRIKTDEVPHGHTFKRFLRFAWGKYTSEIWRMGEDYGIAEKSSGG